MTRCSHSQHLSTLRVVVCSDGPARRYTPVSLPSASHLSLLVPISQATTMVTWAPLQLDTCDRRAVEHSASKISAVSLISTSV